MGTAAAPAPARDPREAGVPRRGGAGVRRAVGILAAGAVVGVGAATVGLDLAAAGVAVPGAAGREPGTTAVGIGLVLLLPGWLLLRRVPGHAVARTLTALGAFWLLDGFATSWVTHTVYVVPGAPGAAAALFVELRAGSALLLGLPLLLLLFPDGRFPRGPVLRPLAVAGLAATALLPIALLLVPAPVVTAFVGDRPPPEIARLQETPVSLPLPPEVWDVVLRIAYGALPLSLVVPFVVLVVRHRRADAEGRARMRWLVWAGLVDVLLVGIGSTLPDPVPYAALALAVAVTSTAVVVAVDRHRLFDVDRLLPTTVVSALLAAAVLGVDLLVVLVAGGALDDRDSVLVAVAVVAVAYAPLRSRLWAAARRVARGGRDDPYGAVATLAERLESAASGEEQLAALARSVAGAFRLPHVRVEIDRPGGGCTSVEHGTPTADSVELAVGYRGETVGRVVIGGGSRLGDADQRLLGDLLRQAASTTRAAALGAALQEARAELVTAREEERRRLRRDLHDSLGPGLAAVTLRVETARALAPADPDRADAVLEAVTGEVAALLADVRRLVHDLRPPALDEMGLAGAVREQARRLTDGGVRLEVEADDLGPLPAAVEVAAYRIAAEAMTNVVRHAGASLAVVSLRRHADALVVTVRDDGRGIDAGTVAGVGTLSVRERAAELGGRGTVCCPPEGGTVVSARLPLGAEGR